MRFVTILILTFSSIFSSYAFAKRLKVVTSFSILENITYNIAGDHIELSSMIKANNNPHNFEPTFSDIQNLYQADIIIINGLGFETWLDRALKQADFKGKVVIASKGIKAIPFNHDEDAHADHDHNDDHQHGEYDPHVWQNPLNGIVLAKNIKDALIESDPEDQAFYESNFEQYQASLLELNRVFSETFQKVEDRKLNALVLHNSFQYFSQVYPVTFYAMLDAHSLHEPSAKALAEMKTLIKEKDISVVFSESIEQDRFISVIINDYHLKNGGNLLSDALLSKGRGQPI